MPSYTPLNALPVWSRCGLGERGRDDLRSEGMRRGRRSRPAVGAGLSEPRRTNSVPDGTPGSPTNLGHSVVDYHLSRGPLLL
jgi:hypothetical protein